jgi:CRP-like cAMP-binding protein
MVDLDIARVFEESIFGVLPDTDRCDLTSAARVLELPAGKLVYDPQVSIIASGRLRAFVDDGSGRHLTVSYVNRPQAIGIAGAAGREFPVAFQAVSSCTVLRLSQVRFDEIRQRHAEIGWAAAEELAHYLDDLLAEIARVAFQPVRARIAHHLLELTNSDERARNPVHQVELAAAVGSVREVVNRTVGTLRDAGLVNVSQAGVTPVNTDGLRHIAGQKEWCGDTRCDKSPT